jgi:hypothetical protein
MASTLSHSPTQSPDQTIFNLITTTFCTTIVWLPVLLVSKLHSNTRVAALSDFDAAEDLFTGHGPWFQPALSMLDNPSFQSLSA